MSSDESTHIILRLRKQLIAGYSYAPESIPVRLRDLEFALEEIDQLEEAIRLVFVANGTQPGGPFLGPDFWTLRVVARLAKGHDDADQELLTIIEKGKP